MLYLAGGNDGLNVIIPRADAADYASLLRPRARSSTARRAPRRRTPTATRRRGSARTRCPAPAARRWRSPDPPSPSAGGGDNWAKRFNFTGTGDYGFDTLYGNGTGGAGSDLAVMPAVDAKQYNLSHFDNSDIWFRASNDVNIKTGWLGRWLERYGSDTNPLQAISIDTALSKSIRTSAKPVCAIPSLPMGGFTMNSQNYGGFNGFNLNAQVRSLAQIARRRRQRLSPALALRPTTSRSRPTCARPGRARCRPTRSTRTRRRSRPGCAPRRTCWRRTSGRA